MATSAFYTFDPMKVDAKKLIDPILKSIKGQHKELLNVTSRSASLPILIEGEGVRFDRATMLFLASLDWKETGETPEQLCKNNIKEKIGRFPTSDGNAIKYLLKNTSLDSDDNKFHEVLSKLMNGLSEDSLGFSGFQRGMGGLELMGWLSSEEVVETLKIIKDGEWSISADEPYDGGVQEIIRHLVMILRVAERRSCGILMRRHI